MINQNYNVTSTELDSMEKAIIEKAFAAEKHVSTVRVGIVIFNSLVYFLLLDQSQTIQWFSLVVIFVALVYCLYVYFYKPYRRYAVMLSSYFISITDALLITFWLYATGGMSSPFYVLWYVAIISIAFRYSFRETMTAAILYSFSYIALAVIVGQVLSFRIELSVRIAYIFFAGALGAFFAREALDQIRAKLELRDLARRLEQETVERRRVEEDLRANEQRLRLIVEQTPAVLWTIDLDLHVTSSPGNGLSTLLFPMNPTEKMNLLDHFQSIGPGSIVIDLHRRALNGESVNCEMAWKERVYQWRLEPLRDGYGEIIGGIGISFDITGSKQAEIQRLQLALEQERVNSLEQFISNISHDLRTPLSVIYTNLYLLERSTDTGKQPYRLETIKGQTRHFEKLIQDILTMSRITKNTERSFDAVDLNRVLQTVYYKFTSQFEQKNLKLILQLDALLPEIQGVEEILDTLFVNLVENALAFTPPEGVITLRSYRQAETIIVDVEDTGIGIDKNEVAHIFEPFYRVDAARSTEHGGTGLGLAIVKKVIEIHDGEIQVQSNIGSGTRFTVKFPVSAQSIPA